MRMPLKKAHEQLFEPAQFQAKSSNGSVFWIVSPQAVSGSGGSLHTGVQVLK